MSRDETTKSKRSKVHALALVAAFALGCRNLDDDPTACSDPSSVCGLDSTTDATTDADGGNRDGGVDVADSRDAWDADSSAVDSTDTSLTPDTKVASDADAADTADAAEAEVGPTSGWKAMSASPLAGRSKHGAVWTGSEMIVWGGSDDASSTFFADGAKYNPLTDTWTKIAPPPSGFIGRNESAIVWTGTRMIVWGGQNGPGPVGDGAAYDPSTDTWTMLEASPLTARMPAYGYASTTGDFFVWGVVDGAGTLKDGAAFHVPSGHWTTMPTSPLSARTYVNFGWVGSRFIVFGGSNGSSFLSDGAMYNPFLSSWNVLGVAPVGYVPRIWSGQASVAGGLIVLGGYDATGVTLGDGIYFDGAGVPKLVPAVPASTLTDPARVFPETWCDAANRCWYWSGGKIVGGTPTILPGGAMFTLSTSTWSAMTSVGEPVPRATASVVWTGTSAIVWGGRSGTTALADGGIFTP